MKNIKEKIRNSVFIKSFQHLGWNLIPIIAFDLLAIVIIAIVGILYFSLASSKASFLQSAGNIQNLPLDQATQFASDMKAFILFFTISFFIFMLFVILIWSFFKSLSWSVVVDKTLNHKAKEKIQKLLHHFHLDTLQALLLAALILFVLVWLAIIISNVFAWIALGLLTFLAIYLASHSFSLALFKRFLLGNLAWIFAWLAVFALIVTVVQQDYQPWIAIPLLLLAIHLSIVLYSSLAREKSWKQAFTIGIGKIHHFIVPYVLAILIYVIYNLLWGLIIQSSDKFTLVNIIITSVYLAWIKVYISQKVEFIE